MPDKRRGRIRRELSRRRRRVEQGEDRRGPRRQQAGRVPCEGLGGAVLQFRKLHHHHSGISSYEGMGNDPVRIQRKGRPYPHAPAGFPRPDNDAGARPPWSTWSRAGTERGLRINKPTVACIVGRWKARLTRRAVTPEASPAQGTTQGEEKRFMDYFGVDGIYDRGRRYSRKKGAVVTNTPIRPLRGNGA